MTEVIKENVVIRPATPEDEAFLLQLYTFGRTAELENVGWNREQIEEFCRMQYRAQKWHHDLRMPDAKDSIIIEDETPVGRIKINEDEDEILIVDIALVPSAQGRGIGSTLLRRMQQRAAEAAKPLRLHVLFTGVGLPLYEKLGFVRIGDDGTYIEMEYRA